MSANGATKNDLWQAIKHKDTQIGDLLISHKSLLEALQQIVDYQPPRHDWGGSGDCKDCKEVRERRWPPSGLCDTHYRELSRIEGKNRHEQEVQHWALRTIARDAIRRANP